MGSMGFRVPKGFRPECNSLGVRGSCYDMIRV